jgi:hypothetical protein
MVAEPTNRSAHRSGRYLAGIVGGLEPPTSCSTVSCAQGLLRFGARPPGTLMCAMTPISALRRSPLPAADASGFDQGAFRRPERCTRRRLCRRPSLPRLMSSVLSKVSKRSIVGVRLGSTGRGPRHGGMPSAIPAERSRKASRSPISRLSWFEIPVFPLIVALALFSFSSFVASHSSPTVWKVCWSFSTSCRLASRTATGSRP